MDSYGSNGIHAEGNRADTGSRPVVGRKDEGMAQ
jgi:hypothetical protein